MAEGQPPPIPNGISPDCHDFLTQCLKPIWSDRPTTTELLKHPFLTKPPECQAKVKKELTGIISEMRDANRTLQKKKQKKKKQKKPTHNVIKL